ncbi:MAG: hypothetical protein IT269_14740, partial [Saprospiraceae bacterium]|nr:hypothetical protein [Saprospiraceae bacterium]
MKVFPDMQHIYKNVILAFLGLVFWVVLPTLTSAQSVLIDVSVNNTTPASSTVFNYKIRYRCASITMHCFNSQITYTIPDALEIVNAPAPGGNITGVTVTGNTIVVSLASPPSAGAPAGALAAGSSGVFLTGVRFKCGTNGVAPVPPVGTLVNFTPAGRPVFTVTGSSATALAPADVTTPTVDVCPTPPTPPVAGNPAKTISTSGNVRGPALPGQEFFYSLVIPAHSSSLVFTDIQPDGINLTSVTGWPSPVIKCEVYSNGQWWDITNKYNAYNSTYGISSWFSSHPVGTPLLDDAGNNIGSIRLSKTYANGTLAYYGSDWHGFRVTTPATGMPQTNVYANSIADDNMAPGEYSNCLQSNNPAWTDACATTVVGPQKPNLPLSKWGGNSGAWPIGGNLGTTTITNDGLGIYNPSNNLYLPYMPTTKLPEDVLWGLRAGTGGALGAPLNGFIIEDLLPVGWDFVTTGSDPNWWSVATTNFAPYMDASCLTPAFTKIPNYNGTGRTLVRWTFASTCSFPEFPGLSGSGIGPTLLIGFTSRWTAQAPLAGSWVTNDTWNAQALDGSQMAYYTTTGTALTNEWQCASKVPGPGTTIWTYPTSGANTDSRKYVKGALDASFSRYPVSGNTNLDGNGEYEIYIQNTGFDPVNQLDVADVLPYIGDKGLTVGTSRGSQWSEELANAITIERYTIGSGWSTVPNAELPLGVMYGSSYNSCYLDGALPTGSITADPASASEGQAAGCTDMSTATPAAGAKAFSFRWSNTAAPLTFGEQLRIKVNVRQLTGEADKTNGEIAWNSIAYTATANTVGQLISSEPIKVGLKMIDPSTTASIGDYVWLDGNGNGRQDAGETPVEGVRVSLYDAAGQPVTQPVVIGGVTTNVPVVTYTDVNGYYCFPGLTPNTDYYVRLDDPTDFASGGPLSGYVLTTANAAGVADDLDSDAANGTLAGAATSRPQILAPTIGAGTQTKTYDFGFLCLGSVTGYVWMDTDEGGDQSSGEMPISGVVVTLKDAATNAT